MLLRQNTKTRRTLLVPLYHPLNLLLIIIYLFLGEGDVFGDDICRFSDVGRSTADVFALTYANVHAIGRDELLGALAFYPEYGIQFAKVFRLSYSLRDEVCCFFI